MYHMYFTYAASRNILTLTMSLPVTVYYTSSPGSKSSAPISSYLSVRRYVLRRPPLSRYPYCPMSNQGRDPSLRRLRPTNQNSQTYTVHSSFGSSGKSQAPTHLSSMNIDEGPTPSLFLLHRAVEKSFRCVQLLAE